MSTSPHPHTLPCQYGVYKTGAAMLTDYSPGSRQTHLISLLEHALRSPLVGKHLSRRERLRGFTTQVHRIGRHPCSLRGADSSEHAIAPKP